MLAQTFYIHAGQLFGVFIVSIAYCEERFLVIREDDFVCVRAPKKQSGFQLIEVFDFASLRIL